VNGYTGKILHVDLTRESVGAEIPPESFYRRYLGGNGLVDYYLLKEVPRGADPPSPENVLVFASDPVTGVPTAAGGRSHIGAKSPLTHGHGEADVGGFFGAELRRAGYDAIMVRGKAARAVYLWVHDGEVEIRPTEHPWGKGTVGNVRRRFLPGAWRWPFTIRAGQGPSPSLRARQ